MFSKKSFLAFILAGLTFALPIKSFAQEDEDTSGTRNELTKNAEEIYKTLIQGTQGDPDTLLRNSVEILTETQDRFSQTIFVPSSQIERCGSAYDDALLAADMILKGNAPSKVKKHAKDMKRKIEESGKENLCESERGIPDELFEETKGMLRICTDAVKAQNKYARLFVEGLAGERDRRDCLKAVNRLLDHHHYLETQGVPMNMFLDLGSIKGVPEFYCKDPNSYGTDLMSPAP